MEIIKLFDIPEKAQIDRRIYVKDIVNNLELNSKEKQTLEKGIETVHLIGVLNESTLNIWSYVDETYYYKEVDVFYVVLKDNKKIVYINEQLQKVFPNPIVIFYKFGNKYAISTALKRLSKLEKGKTVIEEIQLCDFFELDANHIELLKKHSYNFNNLKSYYEGLNNLVATEELVDLTGMVPEVIDETVKAKSTKIIQLLKQKKELEDAYKEADSIQKRMSIHIKLKEIERKLEEI